MHPNILFVSLPSQPIVEEHQKASVTYQALAMPLGIMYMSSYLKAHNAVGRIGLLDFPMCMANLADYSSIEDFIEAEARREVDCDPDIIGISLLFTFSHRFFEYTAQVLKSLWPKATIVVGGLHASNCAGFLLQNENVDYVCCGEGEIAFSEFYEQFTNGRDIDVKGIYSRENIGGPDAQIGTEPVWQLDDLPFPDWDLLDVDRYTTALACSRRLRRDRSPEGRRLATLMTTRGCPFQCTYCAAHTVHGRKVRFRSVENVTEEMMTLYKRFGVNLFILEDDLFTANRKRVLALLRAMQALEIQGLELQFPNGLSVNTVDGEIIDALAKCGTDFVTFAIESGSKYVQKHLIKKNCNLVKAKELVRLCREKGLIVRCYFIMGFPGESREQMSETIDYMENLGADWCNIGCATPLLGSEMHEQFVRRGDVENDPDAWAYAYYTKRAFDTEEISADDLNELVYRTNLEVNFLNNVNLLKGNYDQAIPLFDDVLERYPFHIFALYGLYSAYQGKKDLTKAESTMGRLRYLIRTDSRSGDMYSRYGDLIPQIACVGQEPVDDTNQADGALGGLGLK